jgi:Ca2+-binding RTX toxin-like protein
MATIDGDNGDNTLMGTTGDDIIHGFGGRDIIYGDLGADLMDGGDGDDVISGFTNGGAIDTLLGGAGDDRLLALGGDIVDGGSGSDELYLDLHATSTALTLSLRGLTSGGSLDLDDGTSVTGMERGQIIFGSGNDNIKLGDATLAIYGGEGDDTLVGSHGDDALGGGAGDDLIKGGKGLDWAAYGDVLSSVHVSLALHGAQDTGGGGIDTLVSIEKLSGSIFADTLTGDHFANTLDGSNGADTLTGGKGADTFLFASHFYSLATAPDHITDLQKADIIDLSGMDADTSTTIDDAFHLVNAFTDHAGEAVLSYDGTDTTLSLDINGDGAADSVIVLDGDHRGYDHFIL